MILARSVQIALLLVFAAGCTPERPPAVDRVAAQKDSWLACLGTAYRDARLKGVEKNQAAEQSFVSCGTEERAILSNFQSSPGFYLKGIALLDKQKGEYKRFMIESPV